MHAFASAPLVLLSLLSGLNFASCSNHHDLAYHQKLLHTRKATGPVEVTGDHEFQPPTDGQQRGPCPGLNALANHNYISRDGIGSLLEVTSALVEVYNVSLELATILAVMGVVWAGNAVSLNPSFSIGGPDSKVPGGPLGLLGQPQGLDFAHNFIETDGSATRDDLFVTGDAATMNLTRFEAMFNMVPLNETFTVDTIADLSAKRYDEAIGENPHFFYGPYTGMIARNAGMLFIFRLMGNHPDGDVEGVMTHDTLKSFFAVTGEPGNFKYNRGHERIPEGWYHRPVPYSLVEVNLDIVRCVVRHPKLASIGGNTGSVNSFVGLDLLNPVSGLANVPKLLESNNLICFALEVVKVAAPTYTNNLITTLAAPLNLLLDALDVPLLSLACPQLGALTVGGEPLWESLQRQFPGANKSAM